MEVPNLSVHHEIGTKVSEISHTDLEVETDLHQGDHHEADKMSPENSDYDSADSSYSDDQNVKIRSRASDEHTNSEAGSLTLEREEGDGQESVPSKKVDDDEDKKNPQYIPKRGTFYEHDDRTAEDDETNVIVEEEKDKDSKKKVWQDKKEKWSHDRFNENEQTPKTRTELIGIYGYDIRNEDGPPRARRRRRYGRGPNKYTRNWEDEDAYNKPQPVVNRPKKPTRHNNDQEEFPPLIKESTPTRQTRTEDEISENRVQTDQERTTEEKIEPRKEKPALKKQLSSERVQPPTNTVQEQQTNKNTQQRFGSGRVVKPTAINGFTSRTADSRKYNLKQDQQKNPPTDNQAKGDFIQSQNFTNKKNLQDLEREMNKLSVDGVYKGSGNNRKQYDNNHRHGSAPPSNYNQKRGGSSYNNQRQGSAPPNNNPRQGSAPPSSNQRQSSAFPSNNQRQGSGPPSTNQRQGSASPNGNPRQGSSQANSNNQRQGSVPPRLQTEQKGSKRYSSMRQRSLPETNNPPLQPNYHNPPSFYPNDYNQQPLPAVTQSLMHQNGQMLPTNSQVPQVPPPLQPIPQQVPVTAAPLLQGPYPHAFSQPPPAFLQPGVPTPPFITPPNQQIINYVPGQPPFPPNFQSFPQQFNPVAPPTELYQPQGGITYYSTDQQLAQRQAPQKRPKAAIPIVAPPEEERKSDNATCEQNEDSNIRDTSYCVEEQE